VTRMSLCCVSCSAVGCVEVKKTSLVSHLLIKEKKKQIPSGFSLEFHDHLPGPALYNWEP
jgi:hypothetical protein